MTQEILDQRAAAVIDANKYMTLGTICADGTAWVTPVYFTPDGHSSYYWASSPESVHSRNLARDPRVSIVIHDSSVAIGKASAVYLTAIAELVPAEELEDRAAFYSSRYPELRGFEVDELREPEGLRLYRANSLDHWILIRGSDPDHGTGTGTDSRHQVWPT
ncbi:nitroimidazol reductase NimA-like FMN-containing flavoprotein (pyridoxamine 5'-phosphate oxidase superfamily) [Kribbella amoyensis]|uniref:Nitroimidazol reductase NimA-like FMN-containing flavoprotein (Pyridoxamine 5'-phosphate oxidase superfamily) n=1 Tax=Kribbella amoyensis TaxID=996641 RepID=A0A561B979_9ACTN|nr:pyridoxamine 5'-phosphate oxidase family protein [Kribbella amoyensis]TWD75359.1 nitroimidazol reductase NimA-like FMN-containing flavoprotein (pyridoxamine 5'-phosphate oxidase superfamily) [Kribbella amoyensis]